MRRRIQGGNGDERVGSFRPVGPTGSLPPDEVKYDSPSTCPWQESATRAD